MSGKARTRKEEVFSRLGHEMVPPLEERSGRRTARLRRATASAFDLSYQGDPYGCVIYATFRLRGGPMGSARGIAHGRLKPGAAHAACDVSRAWL